MRTLTSIIAALVMALSLGLPASAQEEEYVQLTFKVNTSGEFAEDTTFFALYGLPQSEFSAVQLQDQDDDGTYTGTARWMVGGKQLVVVLVQGTGTVESQFGTFPGEPVKTLREWREPMDITEDTTFEASASGDAGDDQQDGGDTVTKTFELTLKGEVPAGESFSVGLQSELKYNEGEGELLLFCSDSEDESVPEDVEPCEGNGKVYRLSVELPKGDTLRSTFYRGFGPGPNSEAFHSDTETINADMTNTAWYMFGGGDDQQDDTDDQ
ncbi:MAG: hypothetical protein M3Q29_12525 [Chloroflexota bacterium]|nr:hypothetical protein [Chloroflexota bacterium]